MKGNRRQRLGSVAASTRAVTYCVMGLGDNGEEERREDQRTCAVLVGRPDDEAQRVHGRVRASWVVELSYRGKATWLPDGGGCWTPAAALRGRIEVLRVLEGAVALVRTEWQRGPGEVPQRRDGSQELESDGRREGGEVCQCRVGPKELGCRVLKTW